MTTSTDTAVPAETNQQLDLFGSRRRKAEAAKQEAAAQELSDRIAANYWGRRTRARLPLNSTRAKFLAVTGPKGGSTKSASLAEMMAAGNAVNREGGAIIEATYAGSLRVNFGVLTHPTNAATLLLAPWESLNGETLELILPDGRPLLSMQQLRTHAYTSDAGLDIFFQPPQQTVGVLRNWYTPERLDRLSEEVSLHYTIVAYDTGNEPTELKIYGLGAAHVVLVVTTIDQAKWVLAREHITNDIAHHNKPIMTMVVNEENAPADDVSEVMKQFAPFGPVRSIGYVPIIKSTGQTHYDVLNPADQEQYLEAYATHRELQAGVTATPFSTDPAFDHLTAWFNTERQAASEATRLEAEAARQEVIILQRQAADEHQREISQAEAAERDRPAPDLSGALPVGDLSRPASPGWGTPLQPTRMPWPPVEDDTQEGRHSRAGDGESAGSDTQSEPVDTPLVSVEASVAEPAPEPPAENEPAPPPAEPTRAPYTGEPAKAPSWLDGHSLGLPESAPANAEGDGASGTPDYAMGPPRRSGR